jgi:hypothetical protein
LQPKKNQHKGFFSWVAKDDNELEGSSSSYGFLCFFSPRIAEDDDEWGGSSLSFAMQKKKKKQGQSVFIVVFCLGFIKKKQKMTTNIAFIVIFCCNSIRTT